MRTEPEAQEAQLTGEGAGLSEKLQQLKRSHGSRRLSTLIDLIERAFRAAGQTPPTGDALIDKLASWAETLEPIDTMLLEECFLRTLHAKDNTFVVSPQEVLATHNRVRHSHDGPSWAEIAANNQAVRSTLAHQPVRECGYPGCTERAASVVVARYCLRHGDARVHWREPSELYKAALEARGRAW